MEQNVNLAQVVVLCVKVKYIVINVKMDTIKMKILAFYVFILVKIAIVKIDVLHVEVILIKDRKNI